MRRLLPIALILAIFLLIGGGTALLRPGAKATTSNPPPSISHLPSPEPQAPESPSPTSLLPSSQPQAPTPLHITTAPPAPFATGSPIEFPLTATGGTPPYTWSATGGTLPHGLTFNPITATISGTPLTQETKKIRIRATGQAGLSDTIELPIETTGNPIITSSEALNTKNSTPSPSHFTLQAELTDGTQATEYSDALEASNGSPPYHYSATGLPQGILLDPTTGILTGTPIQGSLSEIQASATDASGKTATTTARLFIQALPLQILTPPEIAKASPGQEISEPLIATGGYPPYTWAAASEGDLPITAAASILTGTAPEEPGLYPITLAVSDQSGTAIAGATSISVKLSDLEITTPEELPSTRTGEPLQLSLEATGSVPPLTWSSTFPFPEDIALTPEGNLTGTPQEPLDFSFQATVTSASGETASRTFTLRAAPAVSPARDLQAFPSDRKAAFTWTLPDDPALAQVILTANHSHPPTTPEDGTILYQGTANTHLAQDLPQSAQLHTAIFATDAEGNFTEPPSDAHTTLTLRPFTLGKADRTTNADPHADAIADYSPLSTGAFGSTDLSRVLGPPSTAFGPSRDVVSLGATSSAGGSITLTFEDNIITNGPGPDFTVFENAFINTFNPKQVGDRFREPAFVSVSQDGITYHTFPIDYVPHFLDDGITHNTASPYAYSYGFAGITPTQANADPTNPATSGGDQFDLATLGLTWIRYVRITSTGHNTITDTNGDLVPHYDDALSNTLTGEYNSGFDLDAVTAIHY